MPRDEEITVEQMYQNHPNRRCRQRAHMVLLSAGGYSQKEIAKILRVTRKTVSRYLKRYSKWGFLGLYDAPIPGRPPKVRKDIQDYKGSKPRIGTYDDKSKIVVTGGSNPVTGKTHYRLSSKESKEATLAFLMQIRRNYPDAEIVIVLDNDSAHHAHIVKEYVEQDKKMRLKHLPSYAPELNDQESIWKWPRKRVSHNFMFENLRALGKGIQDSYRYLQGHPERVLSLTGNA